MNYNDLTLTSLGVVVTERNRPQIGFISAMFRANDHPCGPRQCPRTKSSAPMSKPKAGQTVAVYGPKFHGRTILQSDGN